MTREQAVLPTWINQSFDPEILTSSVARPVRQVNNPQVLPWLDLRAVGRSADEAAAVCGRGPGRRFR